MIRYILAVFVAVFAFSGVALSPARAATLLDTAGLSLLRGHLGEYVNLTNIYTKSAGDTAFAWHDAVDYQGRTFTLIKVTGATSNGGGGTFAGPMIIGGYNPQSWKRDGSWNETPDPVDRTAFLFNLTQETFIDQKSTDYFGRYQTSNSRPYGPYFGLGPDMYVKGGMDVGIVNPYSYGLDGTALGTGLNILGTTGNWNFSVDEIETYAVSAVPLPPSAILFGTALFGMGAAGLRRNRKAAKKSA